MKKHILATAALATFAIAANAEALTVHHSTQGQLAAEITAALAEAGLEASQVTELTVISDVVNDKQVILAAIKGSDDCAAIRINFKSTLKKADFSQAVFQYNSTGITTDDGFFMSDMSALEEVVLPEGLAGLGGGSFKNCTKLVKVNFPSSLRTIGKRAFLNCKSIELDELPDQIQNIGDEAFSDGTDAGKAAAQHFAFTKLPSSIETIKGNAFNNTNVSFSELPEGLTEIGERAFRNTKVTFTKAPSTLKTLGNAVFVNAPITEFTIDGCLETSIPNQTFWCGDKTPRTFYCRATTPPTTSASMVTTEYANAFGPDNVPYITFYVPFDAMSTYEATAPYSLMKIAALTTDVELILDGEEGCITVAHEHLGNLANGINNIYEGEHEWTFTPGNNNYIASITVSGNETTVVTEADDSELLLPDGSNSTLYTANGTPEDLEKQPVTITVPVTASTRSLTVTYNKVKDLPTGVDTIDAATTADGPVYNLAGVRVAESSAALSALPRGIYIIRTAKGARKVAF